MESNKLLELAIHAATPEIQALAGRSQYTVEQKDAMAVASIARWFKLLQKAHREILP